MAIPEPSATWTLTDWVHALCELKDSRNAAILAHWYHADGVSDVADVVGDTFHLLVAAGTIPKPILVVAATIYVAESIKILYPDKHVLVPDLLAGCSLAESCPPELFARFREAHPEALAVVHIHTPAAVKALSDLVVTTGTAESLLQRLPADTPILFAPDHELGQYLRERTGRRILCWFGNCVVHTSFSVATLRRWRREYPNACIISSPQCPPEIRELADIVAPSRELIRSLSAQQPSTVILATDHGLAPLIRRRLPKAELLPLPAEDNCACTHCPYMRLNTVSKLYSCLRNMAPEISLPDDLLERARPPLQRLLEWGTASGEADLLA